VPTGTKRRRQAARHPLGCIYYYWYNRLRKLKRAKNPDADKISVVSEAFEVFRKEAVKRKAMVKNKKMEPKEFKDWLFKQQNEVDRLMDG